MRITIYKTYFIEDKPTLVKEKATNYPIDKLNDPSKIATMINYIFHADQLTEEHTWVLALNAKVRLLGAFQTSQGLLNASLISPREVFMRLCLCNAHSFIFIHNHPSGDCTPSKDDIKVTNQLRESGKMMNINLLDHIIIGRNSFYSFFEKGML